MRLGASDKAGGICKVADGGCEIAPRAQVRNDGDCRRIGRGPFGAPNAPHTSPGDLIWHSGANRGPDMAESAIETPTPLIRHRYGGRWFLMGSLHYPGPKGGSGTSNRYLLTK